MISPVPVMNRAAIRRDNSGSVMQRHDDAASGPGTARGGGLLSQRNHQSRHRSFEGAENENPRGEGYHRFQPIEYYERRQGRRKSAKRNNLFAAEFVG